MGEREQEKEKETLIERDISDVSCFQSLHYNYVRGPIFTNTYWKDPNTNQ